MSARPPHRLVSLVGSAGLAALAAGVLSPAAAFADPKSDPPGNNGTIKIESYGSTDGNANHPHPGCDFRLQLFGFDDDQTGTVTFVGQAPTRDAVTKQPLSGQQLLSDDRAGGGQDVDAHFDIRGSELGLTGAPANQGFHIKVLVNADNAPGGAKSKVFWLSCPAPAPAAPAGDDTAAGTTTTAPTTTSTTTSSGSTTERSSATTVQGTTSGAATAATTAAGEATVQDTELLATTRASALRSTDLAAAEETAPTAGSAEARSTGRTGVPSALAFTGLPAAALAGLGLLILALGALAVIAGRRRTAGLEG